MTECLEQLVMLGLKLETQNFIEWAILDILIKLGNYAFSVAKQNVFIPRMGLLRPNAASLPLINYRV